MSTALEVATLVLPHFRDNVLKGWPRTYGHYAAAIGRDPSKESMVVGMAMHVIGAACVFACIPVAPLHFVEHAEDEWQGVFESEYSELTFVKPHWNVLMVSARIYRYTVKDFEILEQALSEVLPKVFTKADQSPRALWRYVIYQDSPNEGKWLDRALVQYKRVIEDARAKKNAP